MIECSQLLLLRNYLVLCLKHAFFFRINMHYEIIDFSSFRLNKIFSSFNANIHRGVEIVAKRVLQPLYQIDLVWNQTEYARRLREYNSYGHDLFTKVSVSCTNLIIIIIN